MNTLPSETFLLLSYVNTKLRDEYPHLDELCLSLDVDKTQLLQQLGDAGFSYDEQQNRFW